MGEGRRPLRVMSVSRTEIEAAAERIRGRVRTTPVMELEEGAFGLPGHLSLKLELFQHTGSFKPRGAFNRMLAADVPEAGVITASGGNHGQAVAYAARALGIPAEIFVPASSPQLKAERIRGFGAAVRIVEGYYDDAMEACLQRAAESGALLVHPYDQPEVVAGQGTCGRELQRQSPELDTVMVAVGGGGLAAGVAAWYAGDARVVTVEPESCPTLARALEAGEPVEVSVGGVAADSLGAKRIGSVAFGVARAHVHRAVTVSDDAVLEAQRRLWEDVRVLSEPGGAASLAGLLAGVCVPAEDERVAAIICGANTSELPERAGPCRPSSGPGEDRRS